ncbi:MAG: hypothetical protein K2H41_13430 [Acetatifactor sp.]|nr:hypothetical protein [Acetatifactor sp.]
MKTYKVLVISTIVLILVTGAALVLRVGGTWEEQGEPAGTETTGTEPETTEVLSAVADVQPDSQPSGDQVETTENDVQEADEEMPPEGIDHLGIDWGGDKYIRDGEIILNEGIYRAQEDGIYLVNGEEQTCIWAGYIHLEFPWEGKVLESFRHENGDRVLLWIADADYEEGGAEWKPDSVMWLNTNSKQSGIMIVSEFPFVEDIGELWIGNVDIQKGCLAFGNYTAEGNREWYTCPFPVSAPGYQGKEPERMSAEEREEYGRQVSEYLRAHPGEVMDVSVRDVNGTKAWLDLDGNGSVEEIELWPEEAYCRGHYVDLLAGASLRMGDGIDGVGYSYGANLTNYLYAVSLDGQEILIMLHEEGPSDDPVSTFFRYENGTPTGIGAIESFVGSGSIENGDIHTAERWDIIESGYLEFTYRLNAEYRLERVEEEIHEVLRSYWEGNPLVLLTELPIHETPGGEITGHLEPGEVKYSLACLGQEGESDWIYMEGGGAAGWVEVDPYGHMVDLGDDVDSRDAFAGLQFFG